MNSIYISLSPKKIKALKYFSIVMIIMGSFVVVSTAGAYECPDIILYAAIILFSIPLAINPKDHLRTYYAKLSDIYENPEAYDMSIKKSDHMMQYAGMYFMALWILTLIIY